jgi:drug/metabolite transporter (DMT)-like permease
MKGKFQHHDKFLVSTWQMAFGTVALILCSLLLEWGQPVRFTTMSVFAILFCGVLASAFCFTVWYFVLAKIDTTTAAVSLLLVPVFGLFFGWLQLKEKLDWGIMGGTLLICLGVYLATVSKKEKPSPADLRNRHHTAPPECKT